MPVLADLYPCTLRLDFWVDQDAVRQACRDSSEAQCEEEKGSDRTPPLESSVFTSTIDKHFILWHHNDFPLSQAIFLMKAALSIVGVLHIVGISWAVAVSDSHKSNEQQWYRRPLSLGAPSAAARSKHPRVPVPPDAVMLHTSIEGLPRPITTDQPTEARSNLVPRPVRLLNVSLQPTSRNTEQSHNVQKIAKKRKGKEVIEGDRKRTSKVHPADIASTSTSSNVVQRTSLTAPSQSTTLPETILPRFESTFHPGSSLQATNARRRYVSGGSISTRRRDRKSDADIRVEQREFMKEWRRKGLGLQMTPSELAKNIWNMETYRMEPLGLGVYASKKIRDEGGEQYMAEYRNALDKIFTIYSRLKKKAGGDSNDSLRRKAVDLVTNPKVSTYRERPSAIQKKHDQAVLVGNIVRAQIGEELNNLTIEQIEERTRKTTIFQMTPRQVSNRLLTYLQMTRGLDETDRIMFGRKRRLYRQNLHNAAVRS
jgi:hypothetical protein